MTDELLRSEQHPRSGRWAVFEDDGTSAWLYLTQPNTMEPVADCWLYNRVPAPAPGDVQRYRDGPPPASTDYASTDSTRPMPDEAAIAFRWSPDGESVAVWIEQEPVGFIAHGQPRGFARHVKKTGPWGQTWDPALYQSLFG
jgi:hypothetical protein